MPRDAFKSIAACNWTEIGMARDKLAARSWSGANGGVLLMASFLDIGRVMPGFDKPVIFTANKSDILAALASGGAAARDSKYGGVKMTVGAIGGDVVFSSSSADGSESTAACNVEGATQFTSGSIPAILSDALNFVRGDAVTFRCESSNRPCSSLAMTNRKGCCHADALVTLTCNWGLCGVPSACQQANHKPDRSQ